MLLGTSSTFVNFWKERNPAIKTTRGKNTSLGQIHERFKGVTRFLISIPATKSQKSLRNFTGFGAQHDEHKIPPKKIQKYTKKDKIQILM